MRPDPFARTERDDSDSIALRAERKSDSALHTLHDPTTGVVPRVKRVEEKQEAHDRLLASLDRKAPPPAAMWILVACGIVVALQSFVGLIGR